MHESAAVRRALVHSSAAVRRALVLVASFHSVPASPEAHTYKQMYREPGDVSRVGNTCTAW